MTASWSYLRDLVERTVRTFVQAYLGYWMTIGGAEWDTLFTLHNVEVAGAAAAWAVAIAVGAKGYGNPTTASVLKPPPGAPLPEPDRHGDGKARAELDALLARLQRLPQDAPLAPPTVRAPLGHPAPIVTPADALAAPAPTSDLLDPTRVGGRAGVESEEGARD
jgi:hypothetical protein